MHMVFGSLAIWALGLSHSFGFTSQACAEQPAGTLKPEESESSLSIQRLAQVPQCSDTQFLLGGWDKTGGGDPCFLKH